MGENVAITDFMIFGDDCNGFTTSEIAQMVYFLRDGDKRSVACYVHNGVPEFLMTTTVLQHQRLHHTFTFPAHGESTGAAGDRGKLE